MSNSTRIHVEDLIKSLQSFGAIDYFIFITMLVLCALIGVYFAYQQNRRSHAVDHRPESTELEYLVGGRKMTVFPVAMSLIASWVSGIALLGTSTEIYIYGTEYMLMVVSVIVSGVIINYIFLPVYIDLKLTSTYAYLEERFDKRLRLFGSIIFTVATMVKMPIVIYIPALAFNQVTGIDVHAITPAVCVICIFYTCIGGIKAVVWTDVIQTVIMYGTLLLIIVKGTMDLGGFEVLIQRNLDGDRFDFPDFTLDPTVRHSFFSVMLGGSLFYAQMNSASQCMVQRYLSLPDLKTARQALWFLVIGVALIKFMCCVNGLVIYATYHDCDPLTTKLAKAKDQLLPLLVMDVFKSVPGVAGIFIAGVFSATLSSLSTGLNSLAAITLEDFVKPNVKSELSEGQTNFIMKGVVVVYGAFAVGMVYVVQHLGSVLQLSFTTTGITAGPLFAVFIMGLMIPKVNGNCALFGGVSGLFIMTWVITRTQTALANGDIKFETKPVSIGGCDYDFTRPEGGLNVTHEHPQETNKSLYHISHMYYTLFGTLITIGISLISSLFLGSNKPGDVDPSVVAPFVRRYMIGKRPKKVDESLGVKLECVTHEFRSSQ